MDSHDYALDTTWRTLLKDLGVDAGDLLRHVGLPEGLLSRPSARLPAADYHRLWSGIEAQVGAGLPLRLCEVVRSESFSPPLFAALCSPNLLVAAQRIADYKVLVAPIRLEVAPGRAAVELRFSWPAGVQPPLSLVLMELLFCVTLARIGTRERLCPIELTVPALPADLAPYDAFLGIRMRQGEANRVVFDVDDARRPFLTSNEALWTTFEPALRQRLAELDVGARTSERVKAALLECLPGGPVTIDAIASKLALSRRTLQRRIRDEGTSYAQILGDTRASLARHYLERTTLPAAEISFLLGFDEPNSFYRAFRTWTGTTPDSVRRESGAAGPAR